jgi:transposase InsO family protein
VFDNPIVDHRDHRKADEARSAIFSYIEAFYNPRRRHSALGQKSPAAYEKMLVTAQQEATTS